MGNFLSEHVNKDLLMSRTFWGVMISMLATILMGFKVDIGDQGQLVESIIGIVGLLFALYGRVAAVVQITKVAGIPVSSKSDNSNHSGV